MWTIFKDADGNTWHVHCANIAAINSTEGDIYLRQGDVISIKTEPETAKDVADKLQQFTEGK